ncbi:hypothetical protein B0T10DRAFT_468619 [Thelonectria olida]|uniref:Uncharacterized protein n=1 Tax=Thelonectria olida TaxID=1576542 RepID=A0A9P8WGV9_9HYPO|nr:hypothetical protein B0T10DRAFT_468619 [Thelonectria olida]
MDPMRGVSGGSGKQPAQTETPEQLLDVFKAAALSVTKLYKTSAAAQSKARSDGYQDCLDDLLSFLDKENLGLDDGEGWKIRRWATERLDGRDTGSQSLESEDEVDKAETASSPEIVRTNSAAQLSIPRTDSAPPTMPSIAPAPGPPAPIVVPTQDTFTFQSSHAYPNIATLDLSDSRPQDGPSRAPTFAAKARLNSNAGRAVSRSAALQRAGTKRKLNFEEIFDLGSLGGKDPKDPFGNGGKRGRHS